MLRSLLTYLSKATWARQVVTGWSFAWRTAARFVAGEHLDDAMRVIKSLNERGISTTLDLLGEHTNTLALAAHATEEVLQVLEAIDKKGVRSNVSIKLTQIGLDIDAGLCEENLRRILKSAQSHDSFIRIDMEDSIWVDKTLGLFNNMVNEFGGENVGVVIQAYLYRSADDISKLIEKHNRVRLCKGAYQEPATIAYPKKRDVDSNYDRLATLLIDGALQAGSPGGSQSGKIPPIPAIASHDEKRIAFARAYAQKVGLPNTAIEFQMLYGIRRDLQETLVTQGYPVRVYVPFGTEWYPYFTRRLAERPANLWFFLSNLVRK
jgi:proline dehydrogenase